MIVVPMLIAFGVAAVFTRQFCDPASRLYILDHPSERSLHSKPIPRSGGIAVLLGIFTGGGLLCAALYPVSLEFGLLALAMLPVSVISFLDDRFGLHQGLRIVVHFLAAAILMSLGYLPGAIELPGWAWAPSYFLAVPLAGLFTVWMINLYNFMDGMDGFAGGMAVIGFTTFAILGAQRGDALFSSASLVVAGAALGFLLFNFPPARIFLGDTGSSTLGFLVAAFSLWGARQGLLPLWLAVLIFSPFIVDATVTLGRRLARGEKLWLAHKTHYYQRLVQIGWGHRGTLLAEYTLMLLCSLSALLAIRLSSAAQLALLAAWMFIYAGLLVGVERLERCWIKTEAS